MSGLSLRDGTTRRRQIRVLVCFVIVGVVAAACSSSGSSSGSPAGSTSPASGGTTTPPANPAKGEPIVIGAYTPDNNATLTAPELLDGVRAGVEYVNNDLGGLGGRPIKLVTCNSDFTAPGLTACANNLFQQKPLIIIPGPDGAAFSVQPTFDSTGIPLIGGASFTPPEYTSPSRAVFNGFSASLFPAMVHFAVSQFHAKKLTTMAVDQPLNSIIKSLFFDPIAAANGIPKPELVTAPAGSADLTSTLAAALATKPDVLLPFGLPCLPFFQAYQSLGTHVPVILPDNCADKATLGQAGDSANGMYFISLFNGPPTNPNDKDVQLYAKEMQRYAKDAADTDFSRAGFGTVMNIHALLGHLDPATLTHKSVLAAFKAAADKPNFLNTPYNCVAPPIPKDPAICAGSAFLMEQTNGKLKQLTQFVTMDKLFAGAAAG